MIRLTPHGKTNDLKPAQFSHTNSFRLGLLSLFFPWL